MTVQAPEMRGVDAALEVLAGLMLEDERLGRYLPGGADHPGAGERLASEERQEAQKRQHRGPDASEGQRDPGEAGWFVPPSGNAGVPALALRRGHTNVDGHNEHRQRAIDGSDTAKYAFTAIAPPDRRAWRGTP